MQASQCVDRDPCTIDSCDASRCTHERDPACDRDAGADTGGTDAGGGGDAGGDIGAEVPGTPARTGCACSVPVGGASPREGLAALVFGVALAAVRRRRVGVRSGRGA
jgi:MYXO-CTERM domain-containing protein